MPAVSIIVPTYDRVEFLREAVESVRAQTVADWELFVVDDGSSDDTVPWLESLAESRLTVIQQPHSGHKARLRNLGLARWHPEKLERQLAFHRANPGCRWSYTGRTFIDAAGRDLPADRFKPWSAHSGWILRQVLELEANIALPSVMVDRALLRTVGGFNEAYPWAEDYELWFRLSECCECGVIDEPLLEVRKHKSTSYQRPEVSLGFVRMYRDFAARTNDPALRDMARTREAYNAIGAADRLGILGRWREARAALLIALRVRPFAPFVYRAAARLFRRRLHAMAAPSTTHAA